MRKRWTNIKTRMKNTYRKRTEKAMGSIGKAMDK